jgi:hypothetical protein
MIKIDSVNGKTIWYDTDEVSVEEPPCPHLDFNAAVKVNRLESMTIEAVMSIANGD